MVFGSADANKVELLAEELIMRQHLNMNLFTITEYNLVNMGFPEKGAKMEVKFKRKTRSSWLNCALRDDEAVYWVRIGHYEAVAVGN